MKNSTASPTTRITGVSPVRSALLSVCLLLAAAHARADQPHFLIENFSAPIPDGPGITFSINTASPKVGLGSLKADYNFTPEQRQDLELPEKKWLLPAAGKLTLWVKGDGSPNELQLVMYTGQIRVEPDGKRSNINVRGVDLEKIKLADKEWHEVTLDCNGPANQPPLPPDTIRWIARMRVIGNKPPEKNAVMPAKFEGSFELDDMRFEPVAGTTLPQAVASATLLGPAMRDFTNDFGVALDTRNFTANKAKVKVRLSMTDRNQNPVVDRDFNLDIDANSSKEVKLDLAPENIGLYLPPFHVTGDVMSADLPAIAARVDVNIVMANSRILFDNMSNINGNWLTRGYPMMPGVTSIAQNMRAWTEWSQGEAARAVPWTQTSAKITRVLIEKPANVDPKAFPPDRYAMKFDYNGPAVAYTGFDRYFPGYAFKCGMWVKGDGSGNKLIAAFLDYSDLSDFYSGGWKRVFDGQRVLCKLDFTDWRYVEVPLPGNGIGVTSIRGSTEAIDMPIELTALLILPDPVPAKPDPNKPVPVQSGSVLIGPIFADTQQARATTLAAAIAYDDPKHEYATAQGASISVQNAWRVGTRQVEAIWTLADKDNQEILTGKQDLEVPAGEIRSFRVELAKEAARIAPRAGPLRLQVNAYDKEDRSTFVTKEIDLAKPDCIIPLANFESDRGYLGSRLEGITNAPPKGEPAAHTSAAQKHSGNRSLEIAWDKAKNATRFVAVDPPIPGVSVELTLWVKGDGSGALFYPIIGGPLGVRAGLGTRNWNLFIPRVKDGELQDAIKLDFTDWRQFTFILPPIPSTFDKALPVLHFLPSYPQGLHLAVDARNAEGEGGSVFIDDVTVRTHLDPNNRLDFALRQGSESNVIKPDAPIVFTASNFDAANSRKAVISGGVYDWRNQRIADLEQTVDLKPASTQDIVLNKKLPPGAYELRVKMKEGDREAGSVTLDLLVADLAPILGADWEAALKDPFKVRVPLQTPFEYLDEDWDWLEFYPGNLQMDSMRNRFERAKLNATKPWMLLGFTALWASGSTFEQMKAGALTRGVRHVGQGVDIFQIPNRDSDWEDFTLEVMRGVGKDISGWVLWDAPDGTSSLALPPKRMASFARIADKWRKIYCPKTPLIIGGMARATAIPYLNELAKEDGLSHISGVNVRMDVGRTSPEDSQVLPYAKAVREALAPGGPDANTVLLTELDWAVEKTADGLNVFDQAAYLARSDLLLSRAKISPELSVYNGDYERLGTGLSYRAERRIPPMIEKTLTLNLKPAWWAMVRTRELLSTLKTIDLIAVQDTTPQRTLLMLFERKNDQKAIAIVWRNDDAGEASFAHTGLAVESAADILGAPVQAGKDGWYAIGKMPVIFTLNSPASAAARSALNRLWVRDNGSEAAWPQRVLASFNPEDAKAVEYAQAGGAAASLSGRTPTGEVVDKAAGVQFSNGGTESFSIDVPAGGKSGLVLRKRYRLDKTGQSAAVSVNGKSVGQWNLKRTEAALSEGIREAVYLIEAAQLAGQPKAKIEVKYEGPASTIEWTVLEYAGGDFPLAAVGPVHADQQVGPIRLGRNMIGGRLKIDTETFANGIGAYANSLLEYPLNGQFKRFAAKVGVDAVTEGRGSVIFEVWADGKKAWSSGIMSGLDRAKPIDLDVSNVNRLRLIINDAGDGNKFDAGNWCEPVLKR